MTRGQMYDAADTILAQKIAQVKGVGQVNVGGSSLPAVRVELNPTLLNRYGIGLESRAPGDCRLQRQQTEGRR